MLVVIRYVCFPARRVPNKHRGLGTMRKVALEMVALQAAMVVKHLAPDNVFAFLALVFFTADCWALLKRSFGFADVSWGNVLLVAVLQALVRFAPYVGLIPLLASFAGYKFWAYGGGERTSDDDDGMEGMDGVL
ncbi:unnamed protein product [Linum trigynum]|uniref:Uncharacterized protein n=1 Tax=Linum trigynum TaxID=586398 RepID=A0AAV2CB39_9ROSI